MKSGELTRALIDAIDEFAEENGPVTISDLGYAVGALIAYYGDFFGPRPKIKERFNQKIETGKILPACAIGMDSIEFH